MQLSQKEFNVRLVGFWQGLEVRQRVICKRDGSRLLGQANELALKIAGVGFCQVIVLCDNDNETIEEVLLLIAQMDTKASAHIVGLTNVGLGAARPVGIRTR